MTTWFLGDEKAVRLAMSRRNVNPSMDSVRRARGFSEIGNLTSGTLILCDGWGRYVMAADLDDLRVRGVKVERERDGT